MRETTGPYLLQGCKDQDSPREEREKMWELKRGRKEKDRVGSGRRGGNTKPDVIPGMRVMLQNVAHGYQVVMNLPTLSLSFAAKCSWDIIHVIFLIQLWKDTVGFFQHLAMVILVPPWHNFQTSFYKRDIANTFEGASPGSGPFRWCPRSASVLLPSLSVYWFVQFSQELHINQGNTPFLVWGIGAPVFVRGDWRRIRFVLPNRM